jgi:hypothetical protein
LRHAFEGFRRCRRHAHDVAVLERIEGHRLLLTLPDVVVPSAFLLEHRVRKRLERASLDLAERLPVELLFRNGPCSACSG